PWLGPPGGNRMVSFVPKGVETLMREASPKVRGRPRAEVLPPLFTSRIASRNVSTLSAMVLSPASVTVSVAGTRRSSRASTAGRNRWGALRIVRGVRAANRLRSQERVVMESLLPREAGPQRAKGTAGPAPTERQAGKALTVAISQPPPLLLTSMRNRERNHATHFLLFQERGTSRFGAGECGRENAGNRGAAPYLRSGCGELETKM